MNADHPQLDKIREEVCRVREGLRFPFAPGLSEDELVATVQRRAWGQRPWEQVRTLLLKFAEDRQDDALRKYRNILVAEARALCEKRGIPERRAEAEDLVSIVVEKTGRLGDTFLGRSEAEYISWLLTTLSREAVNLAIFHSAEMRSVDREWRPSSDDSAPTPVSTKDDSQGSSPSEPQRTREFAAAVAGVLAELSDRELLAFEMRFIKREKLVTIIDTLKMSKGSASKLVGQITMRLSAVRGVAQGVRASKFSLQEIFLEAWKLRKVRRLETSEAHDE